MNSNMTSKTKIFYSGISILQNAFFRKNYKWKYFYDAKYTQHMPKFLTLITYNKISI